MRAVHWTLCTQFFFKNMRYLLNIKAHSEQFRQKKSTVVSFWCQGFREKPWHYSSNEMYMLDQYCTGPMTGWQMHHISTCRTARSEIVCNALCMAIAHESHYDYYKQHSCYNQPVYSCKDHLACPKLKKVYLSIGVLQNTIKPWHSASVGHQTLVAGRAHVIYWFQLHISSTPSTLYFLVPRQFNHGSKNGLTTGLKIPINP